MSAAPRKQLFGLMAEFDSTAAITNAARRVHEAGYKWFDCHVPFPVHGLDKAMGVRPTILPIIVFVLGLTGACAGLILQTFTNSFSFKIWALVFVQGYDYFISGKPMVSGEAFVPITFELTVLFSAVGCFLILLAMNRLPMWYHPTLKSARFARATDDRFFVVIEAKDPQFSRERTEALLRSLNPLSIEALEA
jgi:hypothetical protein